MKKLLVLSVIVATIAACDNADKIAKVGSEIVTKEQYEAYLKLKRIPLSDEEKYKRQLEGYLNRESLASAIEKEKSLDNSLINAEVEEFRKQLLIDRYFEQFLKDQASDEAIQNFYASNEASYTSEQVHVAHILLRLDANANETERSAILTRAHEVYSKLKRGEDFAALAKEFSEDKVSAEKGGDLGWIKKGAVAKAFSERAFSMNKDEVSEPFATPFGFHIVKVLDEKQIVKKPLEAVKGEIRYQLRNKIKQAETERLLKVAPWSKEK